MESIQTTQRNHLKYEVIEAFNLFVYNPKNRSHKMVHFNVGDKVSESYRRRLRNPSRYLK